MGHVKTGFPDSLHRNIFEFLDYLRNMDIVIASDRDFIPLQIWQAGRDGYTMLTTTVVGRYVSAFRVGGDDVGY